MLWNPVGSISTEKSQFFSRSFTQKKWFLESAPKLLIWLVVWNHGILWLSRNSWERNNHPNWRSHIFQRGRYTTNQIRLLNPIFVLFLDDQSGNEHMARQLLKKWRVYWYPVWVAMPTGLCWVVIGSNRFSETGVSKQGGRPPTAGHFWACPKMMYIEPKTVKKSKDLYYIILL